MKKTKLMTASLLLSSLGMACGVTLQIDFGNTTDVYGGTNAPAAISDSTWNGVSTTAAGGSSTVSGLVYGDNTAATGVTLQLGRGGAGAIDWTAGIDRSRNNASTDTGLYDTSLTQSWFFGANNDNLGVRVSGLAAGEYDVYSINREPGEFTRTYDVGIGVGDTADFTGLNVTSLGDATGSTTWIDGQNFAVERVTVTSTSDFITIIVDPTNANFATIGGLQIVSVPEPSSVALLGLGFIGFALRRRR